MALTNGIYLALASICLSCLCNVVVGQTTQNSTTVAVSSSTAAPAAVPVNCQDATPVLLNGTLFLGTWYEAARKPLGGGLNSEECVQLVVSYDNGTVSSQVTYSIDSSALWINQTVTHNLTYAASSDGNQANFSAIFYFVNNGVNTTYKILQTDYNSYALVCGYIPIEDSTSTTTSTTTSSSSSTTASSSSSSPNSTDASTTTAGVEVVNVAGAFILTRERQITVAVLDQFAANALVNYSDFTNISSVTQSSQCYDSGAGTTVPVLALVMAIVYSLLKFVH